MGDKKVRGNGQGTVYKLPGGKWRAEVTLGWEEVDGKKKRISKTKSGFKLKRDALAYISSLKQEKPDVDLGITFKGIYDLWSEPHYQKISKSNADGYRCGFKYCESIWYRSFIKLKTADLQTVVDACPYGHRLKAYIKSVMQHVYDYGMQNDYVDKNYAEYVVLPPKGKSDHDAFTRAERDKMWKDYNDGNKFTGEILFLIYAGLRFGEYKILTKDSFHIDEHYFIGGIKTKKGINREIPIADCVYSIVIELYNNPDISPITKKLLTIHEKAWYDRYHTTLKRLGIRDLDTHCCRHTTATALAEANVPPAAIQEILGHEDYIASMGYTHISMEEKIAAANKQYKPVSSSDK